MSAAVGRVGPWDPHGTGPFAGDVAMMPRDSHTAINLTMLLGGVFLVMWSLQIWPATMALTPFNLVAVMLMATGLAASAMGLSSGKQTRLEYVVVGLFIIGLLTTGFLHISRDYGTDEIAFDQAAAQLLLHGINPYSQNLARALHHFHVSYYTYTMSGQLVNRLSYPAMAIYPYVPLLALGLTYQAGPMTDLLFWAWSVILFFVLLPERYRWLALLFGSLAVYNAFVVGGVTDVLFFPFLLVASYRWDQFKKKPGYWRWAPAVAFGVAAAVKQTVWFIAPFLFVALWVEHSGRQGLRIAVHYALTALAAFAVLNAPFILASPRVWLEGVLLPLTQPTIPAGQGLVDLTLFDRLGGGSIALFNGLGVSVLGVGLAALVVQYPRVKPLIFLAPSLVLFWTVRSFASYLIDLLPFAILSALTIQPVPRPALLRGQQLRAGVMVVAALVGAMVIAVGLNRPQLAVAVQGVRIVHRSSGSRVVTQIRLSVRNRTLRALHPYYALSTTGEVSGFWRASVRTLSAQKNTIVTLTASNPSQWITVPDRFIVDVFTLHPETVSTTPLTTPRGDAGR